jgi:hypothetical protein
MNKTVKFIGITLAVLIALAAFGTGIAFAQTPNPNPNPNNGYGGYGSGMMGGRGGMMGGGAYGRGMMGGSAANGFSWDTMNAKHQWMASSGGMHALVLNAVAQKLGMSSDELTKALNSGKTITQLAADKGISRADLVTTLETAHKDSLSQAVSKGILTQAQADAMLKQMAGRYEWMLDNMGTNGMMGGQYGAGGMMSGRYGNGGCFGNGNNSSSTTQPKP